MDDEILDNEQQESGFSFNSKLKTTMKRPNYHDIGANSCRILAIPYCKSKPIIKFKNIEDFFRFSLCILAHLHKVATHR